MEINMIRDGVGFADDIDPFFMITRDGWDG
jgi:hypothetical protein